MRVLITCFAHKTHFQGSVPLAWALLAAGHEVRVASQPSLADSITGAGLTAVPVGTDHRLFDIDADSAARMHRYSTGLDLDVRPELTEWDFLLGQADAMVPYCFELVNNESFVDELVEFADAWRPDLVVWEPFTFAGPIAARASGAAHARLMWGGDLQGYFRRWFLRRYAEQPPENRHDPVGDWVAGTAARFGVEFDEDLITGQFTIDQLPARFRIDTGLPTVPMRYVPYNGPSVIPAWLREPATRPRVCVTGGFSGLGAGLEAVAELAQLDAEVVVTAPGATRQAWADAVPDTVRVVDFAPMNVLLADCAAIVHHGGAGTWLTALHHGVPQICLSHEWDSVPKAKQAEAFGAGMHLPPDEATVADVLGALHRVLAEPSFAERAAELRREALREPLPYEVVTELEQRVAHGDQPMFQRGLALM